MLCTQSSNNAHDSGKNTIKTKKIEKIYMKKHVF